ncbi:MAG: FtsX-like permease family protein [Streptosporangiaceae bacterium]
MKPEAIALAVFGVVGMLAALLIAVQMFARQLQARNVDLEVLRALGASPAMTMGDGLLGILAAVVLGSLFAVGVAIGLSSLAPIGPVRPVYPAVGIAVDFTVLSFGLLALIGGIGAAAAAVLAHRQAPGRSRHQETTRGPRTSSLARVAASSGAPVSAAAGVRLALEPGHGRTAVPVRSAMFGAVLAVLIVAATFTFGSGLSTLVSHPALYGWNWNYALTSIDADVPPQALSLLPATGRLPHGAACRTPTPRSTARPCQSSGRAHMRRSARRSCPGTRWRRATRSSWGPRRSPSCTSGSATPFSQAMVRQPMPLSTCRRSGW